MVSWTGFTTYYQAKFYRTKYYQKPPAPLLLDYPGVSQGAAAPCTSP